MPKSNKINESYQNELDDFNFLKDWTDDSTLGISNCICCICKEKFSGYKRRVICKECSNKLILSYNKRHN